MPDIRKPMVIPELNLKPAMSGKVRLSDDMQQTLALLTAMGVTGRKLLKCSESGILSVASPRIKDIVHYDRTDPVPMIQGDNVSCTECLIMAHPTNIDKVWVRPYKAATTSNAWHLSAGEVINFVLDNLNQLRMNIIANGDGIIVAYTG